MWRVRRRNTYCKGLPSRATIAWSVPVQLTGDELALRRLKQPLRVYDEPTMLDRIRRWSARPKGCCLANFDRQMSPGSEAVQPCGIQTARRNGHQLSGTGMRHTAVCVAPVAAMALKRSASSDEE